MAKSSVTRRGKRQTRRKPWGFEPRGEDRGTPVDLVMDSTMTCFERAIGAFILERFKVAWGGDDWPPRVAARYPGALGDELADWINTWVKTRGRLSRRLDDLRRLAERAARYQEQHAPESPSDRQAWARRRLAPLARKDGV